MTEPDEALLWAREQAKQLREAPNNPTRDLSAEIDAGKHDDELSDMAHGYRAGQAASAERVKALEEALGALANAADNVGIAFFDSDDMPAETEAMQAATLDARALLKEADQ